jgi:hypothetical protein
VTQLEGSPTTVGISNASEKKSFASFGRRIQISERTPAGDGWIWLVRLASKLLKRSFGVS